MGLTLVQPRLRLILFITLVVSSIFALDISTGKEISFSIFYLIPIALCAWYGSRRAALVLSVLCAVLWREADVITGATYSNELIPLWNMLVRLGFFVIVTLALAARRRTEAELISARAHALAASKAKTEFLNRVTHELRTPLTAILGFAEILQKRAGAYLPTDDRDCLRRIRANSESLLSMVDGVLDVGSVEARRRPPVREPVDVAGLVGAVYSDIQGRVLPDDLAVKVETPEKLDPVMTDPALLRQVLLNLASNAIKFTDKGTVRLQILADGARPRAISVQDTGIGVAQEHLERIFEPFEQANGTIHRQFGGAGLGLTIARDLCQVMGHRLEVNSQLGVGSTFTVIFSSVLEETSIEKDVTP